MRAAWALAGSKLGESACVLHGRLLAPRWGSLHACGVALQLAEFF